MNQKINGIRRKILVIEDNVLNREILAAILEEQYEVLTAENGQEGIVLLREHYAELSLVILDVYMPVCDGFEFLRRTQQDSLLSTVPVLVATSSDKLEDEAKCLHLGATDFITKPYNPEIVLGRAHSIIKLKESVSTLSEVAYDRLTGLYSYSAFQHHVQEILNMDPDTAYDMAVFNLQRFKLVNSIYGEQTGDQVLRFIAGVLGRWLPEAVLSRQADRFYIFDTEDALSGVPDFVDTLRGLMDEAPVPNLIWKLGICRNVERNVPVTILCDRAALTVSTISGSFAANVAYYDEKLQNRLLQEQSMENSFESAIAGGEFVAWYQPKVDTRTEKLVAAEALVRWIPGGGKMLPPGLFIPLFERDGLVSRLDEYMFRSVCRFQHDRLASGRAVVPISINLSRNSIYRMETVENYAKIAEELEVPKACVPIELTESASIEGTDVLELMNRFSSAGFSLHMDDFGTGYSSFSSLTDMPFDVVKLDKSLIDRIGNRKGNAIVRHMILLAQELGMQLVAEGVETRDQADFLRDAGCDMIQGYFYAPPRDQQTFTALVDHMNEAMVPAGK